MQNSRSHRNPAGPGARSSSGEASGTGLAPAVLIVDDHVINRLILERQLGRMGYRTCVAEDGLQALARIDEQVFDLILTDCNMPRMDGCALARRVRDREAANRLPRVPIIAYTASVENDDQRACIAAGMDGFLPKPAPTSVLAATLNRWLPLAHDPEVATDRRSVPTDADRIGAGNSPVRPEALLILTNGDPTMTHDVLATFRRSHDQDSERLLMAVALEDWPQAARLAHRVKGASELLGADALAAVCAELEDAARRAVDRVTPAMLQRLGKELDRLQHYLLVAAVGDRADEAADGH